MKWHKEKAVTRQEASKNSRPGIPLQPDFCSALQRTGNASGVHNVTHVIPLQEEAWYMTISRKEAGPEK
jgi:hypothetical protein